MTTRRPNQRSSIYLSKSDGKWHGWVTMGIKNDGSPDRRHRTGRTEAEVTRKVRKLEQERDAGKTSKPGRKPTVQDWMTTYLDVICARLVATNKMAPSTLKNYRSKSQNWITPNIGRHRLDRLLPEHLDALYALMADAGKADSTILNVHRILSRALEIATRREKVGRNVAKLVEPPDSRDIEIESLSQDEARRILEAAAQHRNGARWIIGLALGLRQGEALGLRWKYVDLDNGEIKIWWQLSRGTWAHGCADPHACGATLHRTRPCPPGCKRHKTSCPPPCAQDCTAHASACPARHGGGLILRPPKAKSKRVVALPDELVPILKAHRAAQLEERLSAGAAWEDSDLVFCRPDGRPIDPANADWHDWKALLKSAGVRDVRIHDGRHTAGTLLIEQGVHIRTVMEVLGHSDIRMTQRYTHIASPMAKDAARRMGQALWGSA